MAKVFISYRRADSSTVSGRIYDRLVLKFGRDNLFKDVDDIPPGVRFPAYIQESLQQCSVELLIIGREWLTAQTADGSRRLDDPADFVRLEIEQGLALGLTVIPVLVEGASMPATAGLPESLRELSEINAIEVRNDPDFGRDMERLLAAVERAIAARPKRRSGPNWFRRPKPATPSAPAGGQVAPDIAASTVLAPPTTLVSLPTVADTGIPPTASAEMVKTNEAHLPELAGLARESQPSLTTSEVESTQGSHSTVGHEALAAPSRNRPGWTMLLATLTVILVVGSFGVLLAIHGGGLGGANAQSTQTAHTHETQTAGADATHVSTLLADATQTAIATMVHFPYRAAAPGPRCDKGNAPWEDTDPSAVACFSGYTRMTSGSKTVSIVWDAALATSLPDSYTISVQVSNLSSNSTVALEVVKQDPHLLAYAADGYAYSCWSPSCSTVPSYHVTTSGVHTLSITVNKTLITFAIDGHAISSHTESSDVATEEIYLNEISSSTQGASADFSDFTIG